MSGTLPKSFSAQPSDGETVKDTLISALTSAEIRTYPYRHVMFKDTLPKATMDAIKALPIDPPSKEDGSGRRETQNSQRVFMSPETQKRFAVFDEVASLFQSTPVIRELETLAQRSFAGGYLRIEYCQDTDGFWLEPHLDISAKWVTMLIYLSDEPEGESWGTDIYTGPSQDTHLGAAPCLEGNGLLFVADMDTWHGFHPKKITGVRRSLIINVVSPDWRARHELAYPDHPLA